jgi:hypothetical protein
MRKRFTLDSNRIHKVKCQSINPITITHACAGVRLSLRWEAVSQATACPRTQDYASAWQWQAADAHLLLRIRSIGRAGGACGTAGQQAYTLPLSCLKFIVLHIELGLLLTSSNTSSQLRGTRVMLCCSAAPVSASVRSEPC